MKKIRILSIDGGGIRGILPGTLLTYVEQKIKEKTGDQNATIGQYFDMIAGNSTGGILSLLFLCPDANGKFKYSAQEAVDIYLKHGGKIFDISFRKKFMSLDGLLDEKYDATNLEDTLQSYFGNTQLKELLRPSLAPAYDMENRKAFFFTSADANIDTQNYYLRDVARATSSAPTYFQPVQIKSMYGATHTFIDGGVFANNPSLCAYAEARTLRFGDVLNNTLKPNNPSAKDMLLVSMGTGIVETPYLFNDFKNANKTKWIKPLIDIMMNGNAETVDYELKQMYSTLDASDEADYYRIQPKIFTADTALDNANPKNLEALHQDGLTNVEQFQETLNEIVDKLILNH
jgi:patatin-like phospholipase/acyl hydrolase